jgi:hypothetical protein
MVKNTEHGEKLKDDEVVEQELTFITGGIA